MITTDSLICVANFVPKKGLQILINAIKLLTSRVELPQFHLTLVGRGPEELLLNNLLPYKLDQHISIVNNYCHDRGSLLRLT